jgi:hypothetical protein
MQRIVFYTCLLFLPMLNINIFASCGSASCPLNINNPLHMGLFSLKLSYEYIYQDQIFIGSNKSFVGAIPEEHNEVSTLNQITAFSAGYGMTDFLSLDFVVPFIHREHTHIHSEDGETEHWNFTGLGDMSLLTNFSVFNNMENTSSLNILAAVKLPTGITDFKNPEGEQAEVTIQPGTGSTDFIFGASYSQNIISLPTISGAKYSAFPFTLSINYKLNNKGTDDYKFGNELLLHLSTAYRFIERASLLLQVNAKFQEHADVGTTGEPRENTGGKWLYLSPGLKFYLIENLSIYGYFQLPLYRNVNGIQQAAPYNLQLGIQEEINFLN